MEKFLLPIHFLGLIISFAVIIIADKEALSWFRGKKSTLDGKKLKLYHDLVFLGLGILIVSGFFMFWPWREALLKNTLFVLKMFCVLVLVINAFFIGKFMSITTVRSFASLTAKEKAPLFISGAVSVLGWTLAVIFSFVLFGWPY